MKPKNELGVGPVSEPVSFNTESGRVAEPDPDPGSGWKPEPFHTCCPFSPQLIRG